MVNSFIFDKIFVKQRFAPPNAVLSPNKSGENYVFSEKSVKIWSTARVDSFVFLVSRKTKLYETGHCFAEFRKIEKNTKIRKYEKKCLELFRETAKQCFVSYFVYIFF